ncbi:MAG: Fur family transcriptional regulator [Alphaproteobacteria bacterium]
MDKTTLQSFEEYCAQHALRITPPRLNALEIVHSAQKPLTAYDVLEAMGKTQKNPKPPTAYRALDFLEEHGFVHRIESLNAYVSCDVNHHHSGSQFMICDTCGNVEEIHLCTLPQKLQDKVESEKFTLHHWNVELHGVCAACSALP